MMDCWIFRLLGFVALMLPSGAVVAQEDFAVTEVRLQSSAVTVAAEQVLAEPIRIVAATQSYAVFASNRAVWIKEAGQALQPLHDVVELPAEIDWFESGCSAGTRVVLGVASYSVEQQQKDSATPRGGFKAGPKPLGWLVIEGTPVRARWIQSFKTSSEESGAVDPAFMQSCAWDGRLLVVGAYGLLAKLDFVADTAAVLESDEELFYNRRAVWGEDSVVWVALDEGGWGGGCVEKHTNNGAQEFCLLGQENSVLEPDAILRFQGRLLTSSLAGVVAIDEEERRYVHYQLNPNPQQMRVYKLAGIDGALWGLREDGWVRFDLKKNSAVHYQFEEGSFSNNIYGLIRFEDDWYIATEKQLVTARM